VLTGNVFAYEGWDACEGKARRRGMCRRAKGLPRDEDKRGKDDRCEGEECFEWIDAHMGHSVKAKSLGALM